MSLNSPIARLGGWRFRKYPTRKELLDEIGDLIKIRSNLQEENDGLKNRLGIIQQVSDPDWTGMVDLKRDEP